MKRITIYSVILVMMLVVVLFFGNSMNIWALCILEIASLMLAIFVIMVWRRVVYMAKLNRPEMGLDELADCGELNRSADELFDCMKYWSFKERIKFFFGLCGD